MKTLQSLYNEAANKNAEHSAPERTTKENLNFLIDLATTTIIAEDTKPPKDEPQMFNEALNHPDPESQKMARGHSKIVQQHEKTTGIQKDA